MTNVQHDTILIVDDDAADIEFISRIINKKMPNVHILTAKNGETALNLIFQKSGVAIDSDVQSVTERNDKGNFWIPKKRAEYIPLRSVLLDLHMPGLDGFDVLRTVKAQDSTKHIPVVILSSSREPKDIERSYQLGANSYIVKAIDAEQFERTIEKLVEYWLVMNELSPLGVDIIHHVEHN